MLKKLRAMLRKLSRQSPRNLIIIMSTSKILEQRKEKTRILIQTIQRRKTARKEAKRSSNFKREEIEVILLKSHDSV